ncbi:MAG: alpha-amylase [Candidatus Altiarchaeota archaeon]|nr:alpha-amylase [Candidatus Altiarchaeota archaeon]
MHNAAFCAVLHQPWRINQYTFFDIGHHKHYFNDGLNKRLFERIARKSYLPTLKIMKDLCEDNEFKVNLSMTGTFMEQAKKYKPSVIKALQDLNDTGGLEILGETYYHSLAFLTSENEFKDQVNMHKKMVSDLFNKKAKIFRNTESFYNDDVAAAAEKLNFKGIVTEGSEKILGWRDPGYPYKADNTKLQLFMRNYKLSDDIAFRFSSRSWEGYPLTATKYANWLKNMPNPFTVIFIDFETFGEHHWEDTGIFEFLKHLPREARKDTGVEWTHLSNLLSKKFVDKINSPEFISWADMDRDLSAWLGNEMQNSAFNFLRELELPVKATKDLSLIETWRKLSTSDHLYYMSTKFAGDEEVHSYFRAEAYQGPYDAFTNFMNILQDLKSLVNDKLTKA